MRARNDKPTALTALLLGLLLVLVQQIGYAHALSHLGNPAAPRPVRGDTQHPAEKACTQCVMSAQLGTALTSSVPAAPVAMAPYERATVQSHRAPDLGASPPFLSRAPPR